MKVNVYDGYKRLIDMIETQVGSSDRFFNMGQIKVITAYAEMLIKMSPEGHIIRENTFKILVWLSKIDKLSSPSGCSCLIQVEDYR